MGSLELPEDSVVYVDTCIVIYGIEQVEKYSILLEPIWRQLSVNHLRVLSSELTLLEALVLPLRQANPALVNTYEQFLLNSSIQLLSITPTILKTAANLRATTNLKTPDAIHAATALSGDCTLFLTNDHQFRRVPNLPTVVLSDLISPEAQ